MATPPENVPQELPYGSVEGLEANAKAILEEAPTLDEGINALSQFYQSYNWDKEDQARTVAEKYGDLLRYRFKDESLFDDKTLAESLPVPFTEAEPLKQSSITNALRTGAEAVLRTFAPGTTELETSLSDEQQAKIDKINGWEQQNIDAIKAQGKENSLYVTNQNKLIKSLQESASRQRKEVYTQGQNTLGDVGYRFLENALGSIGTAISTQTEWETPKNYIDYLKEHTKDAEGSDMSAYVANSIKGLAGGLGWVAGVEIGGLPYMLATGAGATINSFHDSLVRSGDRSQAFEAGAVQLVNQIFQQALGGKLLGAESAPAKTLADTAEKLITGGVKFGSLGVLGQIFNNISENLGVGEPSTKDFLRQVPEAAASSVLLGGVVEGGKAFLQGGTKNPPDSEGPINPLEGGAGGFGGAPQDATSPVGQPPPAQGQIGYDQRLGLPAPQLKLPGAQGDFTFAPTEGIQGAGTEGLTSHEFRPQTQRALPAPGYENYGERGVGSNNQIAAARLTSDGKFYVNSQGRYTKVPFNPQGFVIYGEQSPTAKQFGEVVGEPVDREATANPSTVQGREFSFKTASGDSYIENDNGQTKRISPTGTVYHPLDKTFYVDQSTAFEKALNRFVPTDADQRPVLTTANGKLLEVTIDKDGNIINQQEVPTIEKGEGAVPIAVNELKDHNGATTVAQSHIGLPITEVNENSTAGAAFTKERKIGERLRTSSVVSDGAKEYFAVDIGTPDETGTLRYNPKSHQFDFFNPAKEKIDSIGLDKAYDYILHDVDPESFSNKDIALAIELEKAYRQAADAANKAGNIEAAQELNEKYVRLMDKLAPLGTEQATGLGLFKRLATNLEPYKKVQALRGKITENTYSDLSEDTGLKVSQLKQLPTELEALKKALDQSRSNDKAAAKEGEEPVDSPETQRLKERYKQVKKIHDKVQQRLAEDQQTFTPEDEQNYSKLHVLLNDAPDVGTKNRIKEGIKNIERKYASKQEIAKEKADKAVFGRIKNNIKDIWDNVGSYLISNALGLTSVVKKFTSDAVAASLTPFTYLAAGEPKLALDTAINSFKELYNPKSKNFLKSEVLGSFVETLLSGEGKATGKKDILNPKNPLTYVGYASRLLNAVSDMWFTANQKPSLINEANNWLARNKAKLELREELNNLFDQDYAESTLKKKITDLTNKRLNIFSKVLGDEALSSVKDILNNLPKDQWKDALIKAVKGDELSTSMVDTIADVISDDSKIFKQALADVKAANEQLKIATKDKDGNLGEGLSDREIEAAAWDKAMKALPKKMVDQANFFSLKQVFLNTPTGFLGGVYNGINKIANAFIPVGSVEAMPLKIPLVFTRVLFNLFNYGMELNPLSMLFKVPYKYEFVGDSYKGSDVITKKVLGKNVQLREKSDVYRFNQLGKGVIGTLATAAVLYQCLKNKDKTIPDFMINGSGEAPGKQGYQHGTQMESKGFVPYSFQFGTKYVPFKDTILHVPAGWIGEFMDQVRYNKNFDPEKGAQYLAMSIFKTFGESSLLKTFGTLFKAATDPDAERGMSMLQKTLIDSPLKLTIPFQNTLRLLGNQREDDMKSMFGSIVSGIPVLGAEAGNKPALDYFGDRIDKPFFESFVERTGLPFVATNIEDLPQHWRWLAQNNYDLPQNQTYNIRLDGKEYTHTRELREKSLGAKFADVLTPDQKRELLLAAGPKMKQTVISYSNRYGYSGRSEEVQQRLKEDLSKIWNDTKKQLFLR